MSQPTMYVVGGPNGAGKTTLSVKYTSEFNAIYVGADKIAFAISPDDPAKANVAAGREFIKSINRHIELGDSLVVETTLSGRGYRRLIESAKKAGYLISVSFVFVDHADTCVARVKQRVRKGGHHVPEQDVRRRFSRSICNFWDLYRNLADEWYLAYNGESGGVEVAAGKLDEFEVQDETLFSLFGQLLKDNSDE